MSRKQRRNARVGVIAGLAALGIAAVGVAGFAALRPTTAPVVAEHIATYTPPPVKIKHAKVAAFLGDSLTTGAGVKDTRNRWTSLVANQYGWGEINLGAGGTGYVRIGSLNSCGKDSCPNFAGRVQEVAAAAPDIVVVAGGRNDVKATPDELAAAIRGFYTSLRAALPKASIVAVSCYWDDDMAPESLTALNDLVRAEVEAVGGKYLDVGQPFAGKPALIGPDGVHPTESGYAELAKLVKPAIDASGIPTQAE